jgi:hypothetical protein
MNTVITVTVLVVALVCWSDGGRAAVDAGDACKGAKAAATGKKAAGLLRAFGKNLHNPNPSKLSRDVSKAQSRFTEGLSRAVPLPGFLCFSSYRSP